MNDLNIQSSRSLVLGNNTRYFRRVGDRINYEDKDRGFGQSVTISDDGDTIAVSGMCSYEISETYSKYCSRVKIYKYVKSTDSWNDRVRVRVRVRVIRALIELS